MGSLGLEVHTNGEQTLMAYQQFCKGGMTSYNGSLWFCGVIVNKLWTYEDGICYNNIGVKVGLIKNQHALKVNFQVVAVVYCTLTF